MAFAQRFTSSRSRGWVGLMAALGLTMIGFGGCGGAAGVASLLHHPVKGKVLLADGKPLTDGQVVFVSSKGEDFFGHIEPDGSFTMKTPAAEGLPEGNYVVRLEAAIQGAGQAKGKPATKKGASLPFPMKYADETTSGLTATIKPGDNTLEPFKLVAGPGGTK